MQKPKTDPVGEQRVSDERLRALLLGADDFSREEDASCWSELLQWRAQSAAVAEEKPTGPLAFAKLMKRELDANAHKGDWNTWVPTLKEAFNELDHHLYKLREAARNHEWAATSEHCADVGNIVMKIHETAAVWSQRLAAPAAAVDPKEDK